MASIFIRTVIIYIFLVFTLKIMGKRQISELEIGELVSTLVVSEVAALPIADPDIPILNAIIPIIIIACLEIIISSVKNKSEKLKGLVEGEPIFLIYRGKLIQSALADNRMSVNELLCELRMQGVADIKDIYYAVLESNGKISVFQKSDSSSFSHTVIVDTETDKKTLAYLGYDDAWLTKELKKHNAKSADVFLMTANDNGETYIIRKEKDK
ncbi:MAG: DUF421 domain-containing protein [Ruminococcaceae bacterium]|nr:DUF421 domain-containing protein [Oscillospiraceae bacterium]